jgi:hypothetical protein
MNRRVRTRTHGGVGGRRLQSLPLSRLDGFDYKGHQDNPHRVEWGDEELVADIYESAGTESFQKEEFREALRNYDLALKFYPGYEKAALNRAILLDRMAING